MTDATRSHQKNENTGLENKVTFFFVSMGVAAITFGFFWIIDFLPEAPQEAMNQTAQEEVSKDEIKEIAEVKEPLPISIYFKSLNREVSVLNPQESTVAALDAALLKGVVRHPDSADFKNKGTIVLLGHSSYLPTVRNKNFQAFNGIQKLNVGEEVIMRSKDIEYVYRIDRVYEAKASTAEVPLQFEEAKLVLVTCNTFGAKEDRHIVEATLVETRMLEKTEVKGS